jgi:hypothetical protein
MVAFMPLHVLLQSLWLGTPEFALPLILKPVGNGKLSNVTAINGFLYFHWSGKLKKVFHPAIEKDSS